MEIERLPESERGSHLFVQEFTSFDRAAQSACINDVFREVVIIIAVRFLKIEASFAVRHFFFEIGGHRADGVLDHR